MDIDWRPKTWVAILLGVFLQAFTFLYLNRPKLFWVYFLLSVLVSILDWRYQTSYVAIFSLICPIHAYLVVRHFNLSRERAWYSKWWGIPTIYGVFFTSVFLVRAFLYEPFVVPSVSMAPTINAGDFVLVKKFGYGTYGTYGIKLSNDDVSSADLMQRGKLYAFYLPGKDVIYVKRLIALPGDTLAITGNQVILNGSVLTTEKLSQQEGHTVYQQVLDGVTYTIRHLRMRASGDMQKVVVPAKSYFFMGDNRDNSVDSRHLGYITSDNIVGEVSYIFKP
ncbi:signal peptidase I [Vibrio sp. MEBiC08052]|uniref:signal peptidase I n=1 Tax=Vibrio sp. MEBiC08052 TaxID=1761910 RepID=UPI000740885D|nr:signal peptidase I [Vibrio sp. MEBiC08052]KUI97298.1 hypothetical protein VRK_34870 [Vibrio sp. MEBiC08052]